MKDEKKPDLVNAFNLKEKVFLLRKYSAGYDILGPYEIFRIEEFENDIFYSFRGSYEEHEGFGWDECCLFRSECDAIEERIKKNNAIDNLKSLSNEK